MKNHLSKYIIKSVLVVDTNRERRASLTFTLRKHGISEIYEASCSKNASKIILKDQINPELITINFLNREIDGFNLIRWMIDYKISSKLLIVNGLNLDIVALASKIATNGGLNYIGSAGNADTLDSINKELISQ